MRMINWKVSGSSRGYYVISFGELRNTRKC